MSKIYEETGYKHEYVEALQAIGNGKMVHFVQLNEFDAKTGRNKSGKTLESDTMEAVASHFQRFVGIHSIFPPNHIAAQFSDANAIIIQKKQDCKEMETNLKATHERAPSDSIASENYGTHYQKGYKSVATTTTTMDEKEKEGDKCKQAESNEKETVKSSRCRCCFLI